MFVLLPLQVQSALEGEIIVKWYKEDYSKKNYETFIHKNHSEVKHKSLTNTITLYNVREEDNGNYICRIHLPSQGSSSTIMTLKHTLTVAEEVEKQMLQKISRSTIELVIIVVLIAFILVTIVILFAIRLNQKDQYNVITTQNDPNINTYDKDSCVMAKSSTSGPEETVYFLPVRKTLKS